MTPLLPRYRCMFFLQSLSFYCCSLKLSVTHPPFPVILSHAHTLSLSRPFIFFDLIRQLRCRSRFVCVRPEKPNNGSKYILFRAAASPPVLLNTPAFVLSPTQVNLMLHLPFPSTPVSSGAVSSRSSRDRRYQTGSGGEPLPVPYTQGNVMVPMQKEKSGCLLNIQRIQPRAH